MIRTAGWRAVRNAEKLVENYLKRLEQSKPNSVYRVKTTMEG